MRSAKREEGCWNKFKIFLYVLIGRELLQVQTSPIITIFEMLQNSAFIEVENEKDFDY